MRLNDDPLPRRNGFDRILYVIHEARARLDRQRVLDAVYEPALTSTMSVSVRRPNKPPATGCRVSDRSG
jgi:hypothetical protein